ncbi:MAG: exodeoxyribonuclease VII large subunit, partial [Pseudomonadota bacterium]
MVKRSLEHNFSRVSIQGEISGLKIPASGHAYFTLKDHNATISAIIWRSQLSTINTKLADG